MFNLASLRYVIVLLWIAITGVFVSQAFHDPAMPLYFHQANQAIIQAEPPISVFSTTIALLTLVLLVYSSAMLWFAHESGKWAFMLYLVVLISFNHEAIIFSRLVYFFTELTDIISGAILIMLFTNPLNTELKREKSWFNLRTLVALLIFAGLMILNLYLSYVTFQV